MSRETKVAPERVEVGPALGIQADARSGTDPAEIGEAMGQAFGALESYRAEHDLAFVGPPRAVYTGYDESGTEFTVAIPVATPGAEPAATGGVRVGPLPAGPALRFVHRGPYEGLRATYDAITEWLKSEEMLASEADWAKYMPMWEEYVSDPTETPPDELVTHIYVPLPDAG